MFIVSLHKAMRKINKNSNETVGVKPYIRNFKDQGTYIFFIDFAS